MRFGISLLYLLGSLSIRTTIARSESLCEGLNKALQDSANRYASLRGKYDFDLGEYTANVTFGEAAACVTESAEGVSSVKCTQRFQSEAQAKSAFENYSSEMQRCFRPGDLIRPYRLPTSISFKHLETSDDIKVRYGALQPRRNRPQPIYYVSLEITHIDPTVR